MNSLRRGGRAGEARVGGAGARGGAHGLQRRPRHRQPARPRRRRAGRLRRDRGRVAVRHHHRVLARCGQADAHLVVAAGLGHVADRLGVHVAHVELRREVDRLAGAGGCEDPAVAGEVLGCLRVVAPEGVRVATLQVGRVAVARDRLAEGLAGEHREPRDALHPDRRLYGVLRERVPQVGVVVRLALQQPAARVDHLLQLLDRAIKDPAEHGLRLAQFPDQLLDLHDRLRCALLVRLGVGGDGRGVRVGLAPGNACAPLGELVLARGDLASGRRGRVGRGEGGEAGGGLPTDVCANNSGCRSACSPTFRRLTRRT